MSASSVSSPSSRSSQNEQQEQDHPQPARSVMTKNHPSSKPADMAPVSAASASTSTSTSNPVNMEHVTPTTSSSSSSAPTLSAVDLAERNRQMLAQQQAQIQQQMWQQQQLMRQQALQQFHQRHNLASEHYRTTANSESTDTTNEQQAQPSEGSSTEQPFHEASTVPTSNTHALPLGVAPLSQDPATLTPLEKYQRELSMTDLRNGRRGGTAPPNGATSQPEQNSTASSAAPAPHPSLRATCGSLQEYQLKLMMLEQQRVKELMDSRQEPPTPQEIQTFKDRDLQLQLMLLEQQNKDRLMTAPEEAERPLSQQDQNSTVSSAAPASSQPAPYSDYQMQLMLLEMQNKKRLMMARQETPGAAAPASSQSASKADYQMQLMLLEQQNKKRLMMAREETLGAAAPSTSQLPIREKNNELPSTEQPSPSSKRTGSHALVDYEMQMNLLEAQNKKRCMMARQKQGPSSSQPAPIIDSQMTPLARQEYQRQLGLLEAQNKKRLLNARQEQGQRANEHGGMINAPPMLLDNTDSLTGTTPPTRMDPRDPDAPVGYYWLNDQGYDLEPLGPVELTWERNLSREALQGELAKQQFLMRKFANKTEHEDRFKYHQKKAALLYVELPFTAKEQEEIRAQHVRLWVAGKELASMDMSPNHRERLIRHGLWREPAPLNSLQAGGWAHLDRPFTSEERKSILESHLDWLETGVHPAHHRMPFAYECRLRKYGLALNPPHRASQRVSAYVGTPFTTEEKRSILKTHALWDGTEATHPAFAPMSLERKHRLMSQGLWLQAPSHSSSDGNCSSVKAGVSHTRLPSTLAPAQPVLNSSESMPTPAQYEAVTLPTSPSSGNVTAKRIVDECSQLHSRRRYLEQRFGYPLPGIPAILDDKELRRQHRILDDLVVRQEREQKEQRTSPAEQQQQQTLTEAVHSRMDVDVVPQAAQKDTAFDPSHFTKPFCKYMTENPTVFHAVDALAQELDKAGFSRLFERDAWDLKTGGKYYFTRNGSSLLAFAVGSDYKPGNGVATIAAHIDAVTTKLKPISKVPNRAGFVQLGVAPYAGGLSDLWWDRDLGIGGRVLVKDPESGKIATRLVKLGHPIARVPSLAVHFGAPSHPPFNKETQMVPIIGLDNDDAGSFTTSEVDAHSDATASTFRSREKTFADTQPPRLVKAICREMNIADPRQIVNWELELFDTQPATTGGLDHEFIFAGRLDDKLCSWAAVQALQASVSSSSHSDSGTIKLVACFDDEEIGSLLRQGARGNLLPLTIERIVDAFASDSSPSRANLMGQTYANSFLVSSDVTHAVNPNFLNVYLAHHAPRLNVGIAISADAEGHMTTNAVSAALFTRCAARVGATTQVFSKRNDTREGGTVGPMLSAKTGMRAIDAGIPQLSMHSIRATTGALDPGLGVQMFKAFLDEYESVDREFRDDE